jgi:hypothetical protein
MLMIFSIGMEVLILAGGETMNRRTMKRAQRAASSLGGHYQ